MTALKEWCSLLCISIIISAVLEIISPGKKMEKILKLVINGFILCMLILPLKNIAKDIHLDFKNSKNFNINEKSSNFQDMIKAQGKELAEKKIKETVSDISNKENIVTKKVDIFMDTDKDNCICISKIIIYVNEESLKKRGDLEKILSKKLETSVEVLGSDN